MNENRGRSGDVAVEEVREFLEDEIAFRGAVEEDCRHAVPAFRGRRPPGSDEIVRLLAPRSAPADRHLLEETLTEVVARVELPGMRMASVVLGQPGEVADRGSRRIGDVRSREADVGNGSAGVDVGSGRTRPG